LRHCASFTFLPAALLEIIKVCRQSQMQIFLLGEILEECFRFGGSGLIDGIGIKCNCRRILGLVIHGLALF